jgi:hypothetical protein
MSTGGEREQREREVLATLLLRDFAYRELPEHFTEEAFEFREYRDLFVRFRAAFIETEQPANVIVLGRKHPELQGLIKQVIWAVPVLNGELRRKAGGLLNHRPPPGRDSQITPSSLSQDANVSHQFHFDLLNGQEIIQMEIPKQSFLVKDLISEQSVNFLSGEEGCGKSMIAMNLGISVAVGAAKWLAYDITKSGKVLYLNNELAFPDFARRLKSMSASLPAAGDIANFVVPKEVPALDRCWEALNETCEQLGPCLVVGDSLYFCHDADENDSSKMKALMRQFLALRDRHNLAVLLIHHTKKGARYERMHNDQMRGSNVFGGITDTVLQMRRSATDERKRIIKPTKFRHVSDENRKCRLLSLDSETLWFRDEGETDEGAHISCPEATAEDQIDFKHILQPGEVASRKQMLDRCSHLGYDERTIDRLLKKGKEAGTLKSPKYGYYGL